MRSLVKMQPLTFSGIPVVCRHCGSQVDRNTYKKGNDGSYLCESCFNEAVLMTTATLNKAEN